MKFLTGMLALTRATNSQPFVSCLWLGLILLSPLYCDNNRFAWDDWSTHQPVLYATAIATSGPIIEFGCGNGSTDLLHEICEKEGRLLITLEDDLGWLNKFSEKYLGRGYNPDNSGWHKFYYVPGKNPNDPENPAHWVKFLNEFELLDQTFFDVCFIDQSPWLARYEALKMMKKRSRFVIVHDVDYFPMRGIFGTVIKPIKKNRKGKFDFHDVFKTFCVYFPNQPWPAPTGPPTLLGSNFEETLPAVDFSKEIVIEK
jgi:hypothetical protein